VNCIDFPKAMVSMAQNRTLAEVLRAIVTSFAACKNVALTRIWLIEMGDLCATCRFRAECPDQSRCLHLVASAGTSHEPDVDLTRIDGLNEGTVQLILSELGLDVCKKWPTEGQFSSWLGLSPNNEISGGKVLRRGTRKVVNRVANALRICAESLLNSKSALGAYARRMRAKRGSQIAIGATANKLARLIYRTLTYGQEYTDIGQEKYETKYRENLIKSLQKRARHLGFQLVDLHPVSVRVP